MKYKYIKTGDIATKQDTASSFNYTSVKFGVLHQNLVEDSLDWIKIVDFEIQKFESQSGILASRVENGKYKYDKPYFNSYHIEEELLLNTFWKIISVKYVPTGEIFNIGDIIKQGVIEGFILEDEMSIQIKLEIIPLSKVIKVFKFITEDGVDLTVDDWCWYVYNNKIASRSKVKYLLDQKYPGKFFSTEQGAKDYIFYNNPILTLNDIIFLDKCGHPEWKTNPNQLIELVKSKIHG